MGTIILYHGTDKTFWIDKVVKEGVSYSKYDPGILEKDGVGYWINANEGDVIGISEYGRMVTKEVTNRDVKRGYIVWGTYCSSHNGDIVNPIFLRRRKRYRRGDAGCLSMSEISV